MWFAQTDDYMGKVLIINPGEQVSLHFHDFKEETMFVFSGMIDVYMNDPGIPVKSLLPGGILHVNPKDNHSMKCISIMPAILFEVSTPFSKDSIRIKDYYGRGVNG